MRRVKMFNHSFHLNSVKQNLLYFSLHHPQVIFIRFFYCLLPTNNKTTKKKSLKIGNYPAQHQTFFMLFLRHGDVQQQFIGLAVEIKDMVINFVFLATASETHVLEACNKYTYLYEHHIHQQQESKSNNNEPDHWRTYKCL